MHPNLKQFTWHSHQKPSVFCRLDYFLISDNLLNSITSSKHNIGFKSDHSLVSVNIDILNLTRGPGYFKLNNSLLLNNEYKDSIKKNITEIALINRDANPNTLWETIKGTIRNETIKFATHTRKQTRKQEEIIESEIVKLQKDILETSDNDKIEYIKKINWKKIMH